MSGSVLSQKTTGRTRGRVDLDRAVRSWTRTTRAFRACALHTSCALAVVAFARSAAAEEPDEPAVVTVRGRQAGGFVSRASVDDAPREITDVASLIEPMPGVHVRRLGSDDTFATMSIRGASSSQVAIVLAGVPLTGGSDPSLDLATLPLWPGARARVYRSFAPATLGRGSLGGTLALDPPSPRQRPRTDVWIAAGSYGSRRLRVGDVSGDEDGLRVATGLSASRADDDFTYLDPASTAAAGHDVFARRVNAGHAQASGLVSLALPVRLARGARGALTTMTLAQGRRQHIPGTVNGPTPDMRLDSSRLLEAVALTLPLGHGAVGVRGWGRREGYALRDSLADARLTLGPTSTDDAILAAGGSVGWKGRPIRALHLEARVDGSAERYAPGSWEGGAQPPSARRTNAGLAVDASTRAIDGVVLAASGRGDAWVDTSSEGPAKTTVRPTGNVGVETALGPVAVASHAGVLTRPASFVERYGNRGLFIGDPDLRPETAATIDAGGRFAKKVGPVRLELEASVFATWASDLIVFVGAGAYGRTKATNIGAARLQGLEASARARAYGFELRASDTALATANESACTFAAGGCERPPLPGRPTQDFALDLIYERGPVRLRYGLDVVAGIRADATGQIVVPDRALHSASVHVKVPGARGLTLGLDLRNLFDLRAAAYRSAFGPPVRAPIGDLYQYPLPGRRVLLTARFTVPPHR